MELPVKTLTWLRWSVCLTSLTHLGSLPAEVWSGDQENRIMWACVSFREALAQDLSKSTWFISVLILPSPNVCVPAQSHTPLWCFQMLHQTPAHLFLHLAGLLGEMLPRSSCRGVGAPPVASSSCAVAAALPSHGSLYGQLRCSGQSLRGQRKKFKDWLRVR